MDNCQHVNRINQITPLEDCPNHSSDGLDQSSQKMALIESAMSQYVKLMSPRRATCHTENGVSEIGVIPRMEFQKSAKSLTNAH